MVMLKRKAVTEADYNSWPLHLISDEDIPDGRVRIPLPEPGSMAATKLALRIASEADEPLATRWADNGPFVAERQAGESNVPSGESWEPEKAGEWDDWR
jgi:hypothetical protein